MVSYGTDWESLTQNYRNHLRFERNLSANTIDSYLRDLSQFRAYIASEHGELLPGEISEKHIEAYMAATYDRGVETTTQARVLSGIRSFFHFLLAAEVIEASPTEFVEAPKTGRKLPNVLSVEEIDAILGSIDLGQPQGHRNKAMLETLYSCGLRVSELIALRTSDLFFDDGFLRVVGKGDKQRLVPVSDTARRNIELWLGQRLTRTVDPKHADFVFLNRNGRCLTRVMVFTILREAALRAGIPKPVSPHTLRHSFATHLLEGGASIRQVQEMLGHESILTTEIYTHLDRTHLRRSLEKHHPLK